MVQVVMNVRLIIINLLLAFRRKTEIYLTALRQAWEEGERWAHYRMALSTPDQRLDLFHVYQQP